MENVTADFRQIIERLDLIKFELSFIKKHMVDADSILTEDDYEALMNYRKEKASGRLASHAQLKKDMGL